MNNSHSIQCGIRNESFFSLHIKHTESHGHIYSDGYCDAVTWAHRMAHRVDHKPTLTEPIECSQYKPLMTDDCIEGYF